MIKESDLTKVEDDEGEDTGWLVWEETPQRILALRRVCFIVAERRRTLERNRLRQLRRVPILSKERLSP